jgi:hypothetical protein
MTDNTREGAQAERWFAARRAYDRSHRPRHYTVRLAGQPADGFVDIGDVMTWLSERGHIERVDDPDEGTCWTRWGDPFCAVAGSRTDPWEAVDA